MNQNLAALEPVVTGSISPMIGLVFGLGGMLCGLGLIVAGVTLLVVWPTNDINITRGPVGTLIAIILGLGMLVGGGVVSMNTEGVREEGFAPNLEATYDLTGVKPKDDIPAILTSVDFIGEQPTMYSPLFTGSHEGQQVEFRAIFSEDGTPHITITKTPNRSLTVSDLEKEG